MRTNRFLLACSTLAALMTACGDDGGDDSTSGASASASASATEGSASESASASATDSASGETASASESESASASASASDTTDPSTTTATTDDSATATDPTTDGTGGGGDACAPEADDDECSMCLKSPTAEGGCCDQLTACRSNADCACVVDCLDEMGMGIAGLGACQTQCMVDGLPPGGLELSMCQSANCMACNE